MNGTKSAISEGTSIAHRAGRVLVTLTSIRPGIFRVAVAYGSTGAEIPELTGSYADESFARTVARNACRAFAGGRTVGAVLADLGYLPKAVEA